MKINVNLCVCVLWLIRKQTERFKTKEKLHVTASFHEGKTEKRQKHPFVSEECGKVYSCVCYFSVASSQPRREEVLRATFCRGDPVTAIAIETRALDRKSYDNLHSTGQVESPSGDDGCMLRIFNNAFHDWKVQQTHLERMMEYSCLVSQLVSSQSPSSNHYNTTTTLEATEQHTALNVHTL